MGGSEPQGREWGVHSSGCSRFDQEEIERAGNSDGCRDRRRHGISGPVQPDGYVEVCVNLGWRDLNPQKILSELLDGMPIRSGNDANVAALGEMWQGGGKGCHDIVMVTLGTGVGGGVVHDQKIVAGRHGLGGEIGHIHIREGEKETCNCGGHGCLEQVASATGIAREARRKMAAKAGCISDACLR